MDNEKLFDEKLKKRINEENVIVPPELNEKINRTLHNLPVKKKGYRGYRVYMLAISTAVLALSIVSMSEFSDQIFAQNGGVFEYVKKKA
ncbi:anti-sigma factor, partial [Bacillus sp. MHSD17]|nr:anti-sigma factor [Bacillus sp. MHSD17]